MVDQKSVITVLIIVVCVMVGVFLATLKKNDRLTSREMSVLGFFRSLIMWSAVLSYLTSLTSFLTALALRISLIRQDDLLSLLGQPIASQFDASALLYFAAMSFVVASAAVFIMLIIAIEMHLRRIANAQDRPTYFNN
jgi:hypothetical protein